MPRFKDYFSQQATGYSRYRPHYPATLYAYLSGLCAGHDRAWDCATGSGQAARGLADHFTRVIATDASRSQIDNATGPGNVRFHCVSAEQSGLAGATVDLVTVAQALHWFDRPAFYQEVRRVIKPGGLLAVWSYNLLTVDPEIDRLLYRLSEDILRDHWPAERQLVRDGYRTIDFPFAEQYASDRDGVFHMAAEWSLDDLLGYLGTWSSVMRYRAARETDPLEEISGPLRTLWGGPEKHRSIRWPLSLRVGKCY